jgi:uncharacterized protein YhhL (DUF1145 family)
LYWLALLLVVQTPLAKPFTQLLVGVTALLLVLHVTILLFFGRQAVWRDRLQLLLFGAFHWPTEASEDRSGGRQAD